MLHGRQPKELLRIPSRLGNWECQIGALVRNTGLGKGELVELRNNLLDLSPSSDDMQNIETLRSRGVIVQY